MNFGTGPGWSAPVLYGPTVGEEQSTIKILWHGTSPGQWIQEKSATEHGTFAQADLTPGADRSFDFNNGEGGWWRIRAADLEDAPTGPYSNVLYFI
jgi:hypothetical protein